MSASHLRDDYHLVYPDYLLNKLCFPSSFCFKVLVQFLPVGSFILLEFKNHKNVINILENKYLQVQTLNIQCAFLNYDESFNMTNF